MKKNILLFCACAITSISLFACNDEHIKGNGKVISQERTVSGFDKISLGGSIDIDISQNGNESATVETDENMQSVIVTEVEGSTLKIHVKENVSVNPTKMIVHVNCKNLKSISSGGSGDIESKTKITAEDFSVSHGGSGDYKLQLAVQKLKISKAGSGDFILSGSCDEMKISSAGSGNVNAENFICASADISSAGSGDVILKKGTVAKVSVVGSGEVSYK